jgi:hypothetical protein
VSIKEQAIKDMHQALIKSSRKFKRLQIIRDHGYFSFKRLYKRLHREKMRESTKARGD